MGLGAVGTAGGSVLEDLDGDGDLDVMASSWNLADPLRVFRNDGKGVFSGGEALIPERSTSYAAALADLDGDGDLDVVVGNDRAGRETAERRKSSG